MPGLTKKTLARSESKQSQYDLGKHPANPVKLGRLTQQIASTRTQKKKPARNREADWWPRVSRARGLRHRRSLVDQMILVHTHTHTRNKQTNTDPYRHTHTHTPVFVSGLYLFLDRSSSVRFTARCASVISWTRLRPFLVDGAFLLGPGLDPLLGLPAEC